MELTAYLNLGKPFSYKKLIQLTFLLKFVCNYET